MNLPTMVMDTNDARRAFLEYRDAFRQHAATIDGELMRAYRELSAGKTLIRLTEAVRVAGADERGLPKIAIARADERRITVWRDARGVVQFEPAVRSRATDRRWTFPAGTLPAWPADKPTDWFNWNADIPLIPPRFRPPFGLANYHVLWEPVWRRNVRRAALDPALLKHIGGDLYAVLATWDLTPIERAVLEMR